MTLRVVVTGPECTGKTTLAATLGAEFDAPWLGEAAREYAADARREGRQLGLDTVEPIARRAVAAEDAALLAGPALLVLDTDLISTVVYSRHYYGTASEWLVAEARARRGDLYLLCAPDIPWTADGIRDRPEGREAMFTLFRYVLAEFGATVVEIRGQGDARKVACATPVRALIAERATTAR
jgi:NadR type nicotinamide-nucleotide adenylyltransferase